MAGITIHIDDDVSVDAMTQQAIDGEWPMSISVQSFCGEGASRQIYHRDSLSLFGGPKALRKFAALILAALPAEQVVESDESYEASEALLKAAQA